ncbi:MAG TPA: signal peptidase I [Candidatus Nanoarchaeia archaeon]|nr:signal peptidase I [Candidatus Nanoarchaeia archaeon]
MSFSSFLKKMWQFLWYEDSLLSWLVNLILAFILVKFLIYPGIGLVLGTQYPVVAVVSGSMEHNGQSFDEWWISYVDLYIEKGITHGDLYIEKGITQEQFRDFSFHNGFNKGDIMVLKGIEPKAIKVGDVLVYESSRHVNPIIHRVVNITQKDDNYLFETKGDNNPGSDRDLVGEHQIRTTGKAVLRFPFLGWIKIGFVQFFGGVLA